MQKTKWPRKQIGIKLDMGLWRDIKIVALEQDRTATEVVEDALTEYTERHRERISREEFGKRTPVAASSALLLSEKENAGENPEIVRHSDTGPGKKVLL